MRNRKPRRSLKIRTDYELVMLVSFFEKALACGVTGRQKSAVDRWLGELRAMLPNTALSTSSAVLTDANVLELDGTPHQRANEADSIRTIFDHWCKVMEKPAARLDSKRRSLIARRLADGYTPDELTTAISGCAADPWSMGDNDRGKPFNELSLILRDAERIERYTDYAKTPPRPRSTASSVKATKVARAAWRKVVAHVRAGKHRRGASLGNPTDKALNLLGGYSAVGMATERQLFDLERGFIETFLELVTDVDDEARLRPLRTDAERRS